MIPDRAVNQAGATIFLFFLVVVVVGFLWRWRKNYLAQQERSESADKQEKIAVDEKDSADQIPSQAGFEIDGGISSLPDALILLGEQWQLKWANQTACQWFGINLSEDSNRPLWQLVKIPGFADFLSVREFSASFECAAPAGGGIQLSIRVVPYRENQYLLQGREITQVRQLEQIRRDFVANASHELRTPLSIIYGYLEMMLEEPDEVISAQWKPAVHQMYGQTERIKQIIDDMMLLSRLEDVNAELDHQFLPVAPLMEAACRDAEALSVHKGHRIIQDIEQNYSLLCDGEEIRSLVMNLISNAVRYTPDNGSITIKWSVDLAGGSLSVTDTGIGIEQENIPRLTERFYRTDPARSRAAGGTGLGLAIVNHIVNRHQASLEIQSKVGQGSEFSVHFPMAMILAQHDQVNLLLN